MKKTKRQKWIDAGITIASNPIANVLCPECENEILKILDIKNEKYPSASERYIYCQNCNAKNILRLKYE